MIRISLNLMICLIAKRISNQPVMKLMSTYKDKTQQQLHEGLIKKIINVESSNELDFTHLSLLYEKNPTFDHFIPYLPSTLPLHQHIFIFRTFKLMQDHPYVDQNYQRLYQKTLEISQSSKTDNLMLLLAKIKVIIAKQLEKRGKLLQALNNVEDALNKLEECVVPPVLQYYQTYRYMGSLQYKIGNKYEAKEALSESVKIIDQFIAHSDDHVQSPSNTAAQAIALTYLAILEQDSEKRKEWLSLANKQWKHYPNNVYDVEEYALTICENLKQELTKDKNNGLGYYFKEIYMLGDRKEMKQLVQKVKIEWQKNKVN